MGRPLRFQIAGGCYHVTSRGNRRQPIYLAEFDQLAFMALLGRVVEKLGWRCHGYCLMPNHYHLVLETPEPNLSIGMQHLNGVHAKWFNWAHGFEGHLFERRFHSVSIESDAHMVELSRYLALNPVRAGLCGEPSEWRWSSHAAMLGRAKAPEFLSCSWLLSLFGSDSERARGAYAAFVNGQLVAA